jgi:metal-responsive CopG/Arc/MetJ family transcriptional regulator
MAWAGGRKKEFHRRITVPMTRQLLAEIDAARGDVPRVAYIRRAIERTLAAAKASERPKRLGRGR